jgi:predicted transglutaminase-like cysteine proteinase
MKMQKLGIVIKSPSISLLMIAMALSLGACTTTTAVSSKIQLSSVVTPPSGLVAFCADIRAKCHVVAGQDKETHTVSTGGQGDAHHLRAAAYQDLPLNPAAIALQDYVAEQNNEKTASISETFTQNEAVAQDDSVTPSKQPTPAPKIAPRIEVSADMLPAIKKINLQINNKITWQSDLDRYGLEERWTMPLAFDLGRYGDCEDFALEKRRLLLEMGIPAGALALATTTSKATGSHAVLVIRTTQGDYVLDNTTPWVLPWTETDYKWITIQEGSNLLQWRAVASREMGKTKS